MRSRVVFALVWAAAVEVWAQQADPPTLRERLQERREQRRASPTEPAPGVRGQSAGTQVITLQHGGLERRYLLHVPASFRPGQAAPLVLAFHGGGGHAEFMADDERYGLVGKSESAGFLLVFPNGVSRFRGGRLATWNAGGCCGDARDRGADDVGFVRAVVEDVRRRVDVDSTRVFATGMSNGGMMVHRLACDAADLFRAVAAVAGTDATSSCQPSRPVSVLQVHARDDDHVRFDGGAGPAAFRDKTKVMDFVSVPDTVARWTQRLQCQAPARRVLERPGALCEAHAGCAGGVSVQLCVTDEGGHAWPGARQVRRGKAAASAALDANEVIWDFFLASPVR